MDKREAQTLCSTTERNLLYWSWWPRLQNNSQKCKEKNWKDLWHQPCRAKEKLGLTTRKWLRRKVHPNRFQKRFMVVDTCHTELEPKFQKYKDRVVLRGDIVKDDSVAYAFLLTEYDSCASQMTVVKVMDVIARLPDYDGEAADAVSAYTQVKMEDAPRLLKIPKSECPDVWIRHPRNKSPKSLTNIEDLLILLERN